MIRRCYELGESDPYHGVRFRRTAEAKMPAMIASQITENPERYPGFLVSLAEETCRRDVAAKIVPVAAAATSEHWFEVNR